MKTLTDINQRISELATDFSQTGKYYAKNNPKQSKVIATELAFLRSCKIYLESEPTEEFVASEIERVKAIIISKNEQFEQWKANNSQNPKDNPTAVFRRMMNLDNLENQLFTLTFLYY